MSEGFAVKHLTDGGSYSFSVIDQTDRCKLDTSPTRLADLQGRSDSLTAVARPERHEFDQMTPEEVKRSLLEHIGLRVRITFADDVVESVDIASVDDEGVLHSGPEGVDPSAFWTRFESIRLVERAAEP